MKQIENLDTVLNFLFKIGVASISEYELQEDLQKNGFDFSDKWFVGGNNSLSRLELILEKLQEDGYIDRWDSESVSYNPVGELAHRSEKRVRIKYEGIIFKLRGGYDFMMASLDEARKIPVRLNTLTLWLVIGSFALALIEVVRFIHDIFLH